MQPKWIKPLFLIAAAYDLVLGVAFACFFRPIYAWAGVALPNHDAYVQFTGAVVAIFGFGFVLVARNPGRNRDIILMGILLKLAYGLGVLGHYFFGSIPTLWIPFAYADLLFAVLFVLALRALERPA